jgi:16S rRNA (uracil1498-N3)-methyltransferase
VGTPPLFFVDHLPRTERIRLEGDEGRHAARVRRVEPGEAVMIADGLGAVADCVVAQVLGDGVDLDVLDWRTVPLPDPALVVGQAIPKGDRAELAVEVMTELGVDEIIPWTAARSVVKWRDGRDAKALERWRRTAREAAKQSRRPRVPMVTDSMNTAELARYLGSRCALVLHEDASEPLARVDLPQSGEIVLVVGPEGGVADDELRAFTEAGAVAVHLGEPILRTSTAGAAALAALSVRMGRWG